MEQDAAKVRVRGSGFGVPYIHTNIMLYLYYIYCTIIIYFTVLYYTMLCKRAGPKLESLSLLHGARLTTMTTIA